MSSTVWEKQAQALKAAGAADRKPAFSLPSKDIKKQSTFSGCLQNFVRPVSRVMGCYLLQAQNRSRKIKIVYHIEEVCGICT